MTVERVCEEKSKLSLQKSLNKNSLSCIKSKENQTIKIDIFVLHRNIAE